jgi:enoyl-CoA hydratase
MAVEFEQRGPSAIVKINRPDARNAVNGAVAQGLEDAIDRIEGDDEIWVGIITGEPPVFSAGADLKEINAGNAAALTTKRGGFAGMVQRERTKPLIAAVDGPALAGGCEIVLACDLVVAAEGASFGIPEVKRSLVAAGGGLLRLPRRIPYHAAMELALLGNHVPAPRMHDFGLVNRLVPDGQALDAALQLAGEIAANGPLSLIASKRIVVESKDWTEDEAWAKQEEIARPVGTSADAREGAIAFAEKRPPVWQGR